MEPGLFGLIQRMTGQPDVDQQIAQAMGRGPGQPGGPPATPLNPPPLGPAGAGGPAAAGPTPAVGGPAAAPAAPPTPQAYTSTPDMGQLYFQLARQEQAAQMFNQGLAGMAASLSRSPDRNKYLSMGQVQPMDPGQTFGNLMKLQQYQMGQQRFAATQAAVPGMLKGYGITDPAQIAFYQNNPDQLQTLIAAHAPEGTYKSWLLARDDFVQKSGADPNDPQAVAKARAEFEQKNPLVNALTPAGGDPELNALNLEKANWQGNHLGQPLPDDGRFNSPEDLRAYKNHVQQLSDTQNSASNSFPALNFNLLDMRSKATAIANMDPDKLNEILTRAPNIISLAQTNGWLASKLPAGYDVTQDQLNLLHQIVDLSGSNTSGMKQANPHLISSILPIEADLSGISSDKFGIGAANFQTNAKKIVDDIDTARAQGIGASGLLSTLTASPEDKAAENKINDSYLPGGRNYLGEGKPMPAPLIAQAKEAIKAGADRNALIKRFKIMGYLPKGEF